MGERITAIITWIRETWTKATKRARLVFLISVASVLLISLVLTMILNHKEYVVLYNDLSSTENADVIAALSEANVPYDVDNGRLLVESKDEDRARLQLAVLGFQDVGFKYDLANSGGLTATQQDKDRNVTYQLQERLQATFRLLPEISNAVVTISIPEKSAFSLDQKQTPISAAVMLQKKSGRELTVEQVQAISNIVRGSVYGLTDENITIADETGDLKSMLDLNSDFNNKKLNLTEQVNTSLEDHIKEMVLPPYGQGNIEVSVMTALNTDSRVAEQTTYQPLDPENPTNNPLDYSEFDRQKTGDGFAAAGGVPGAQDNVGTTQYAAQEAEAADSAYYSGHDIYDYLVSSLREQIVKDGFEITKASAAILINATTLPDGERDAIISLASSASGIAPENITVQNIKFATNVIPEPTPEENMTRIFIIAGIGLLALCIILIIILTAMSRRKARLAAEAAAAELEMYDENGMALIDRMNQEIEYEPIALAESAEQKLKMQIKDLAESDPEIVAQLIKTWLVSGK